MLLAENNDSNHKGNTENDDMKINDSNQKSHYNHFNHHFHDKHDKYDSSVCSNSPLR